MGVFRNENAAARSSRDTRQQEKCSKEIRLLNVIIVNLRNFCCEAQHILRSKWTPASSFVREPDITPIWTRKAKYSGISGYLGAIKPIFLWV